MAACRGRQHIAETAWYERENWDNFAAVVEMLFDMWEKRAAYDETDEGQFRIVCAMPGPPKKGDPARPFAKSAVDRKKLSTEVSEELRKKLNNDLIEVEIREVDKKYQHDRYLVVHNGAVVVSSSKGFDFRPGEPSELGFRRLERGDVVSKILDAKLLTDRPANTWVAEEFFFLQPTA